MAAISDFVPRVEALARKLGLDYHPVDFEIVPTTFMMEVAVYGLPVRMPHWSFGVRYMHELIRRSMGHSRIFEVMFPGDPCHAYLVNNNTLAENTLVVAHVLGHADFARNNQLFARFEQMAGTHIVEHAAAQAHRIEAAVAEFGQQRVEAVLDAALALEAHVDVNMELHRPLYPTHPDATERAPADPFRRRFQRLPGVLRLFDAQPGSIIIPARILRGSTDCRGWQYGGAIARIAEKPDQVPGILAANEPDFRTATA